MTFERPEDGFGPQLHRSFPELEPTIGDLFLLEAHQVHQLPSRAPADEFAAVVGAYPELGRFFWARAPEIGPFLGELERTGRPLTGEALAAAETTLLWELADWIVYQRAPELYDALPVHNWDFCAITDLVNLDDKIVVDGGAGTGRVAFEAAGHARTVYAVEPVAALRSYMRRTAQARGIGNVYALDGLLHEIPLPDDSVDVVITCRAIGWNLDAELVEIDRVLTQGGSAVHLHGTPAPAPAGDPVHAALTRRGYVADCHDEQGAAKRRYHPP